jgi:hypothetical protein
MRLEAQSKAFHSPCGRTVRDVAWRNANHLTPRQPGCFGAAGLLWVCVAPPFGVAAQCKPFDARAAPLLRVSPAWRDAAMRSRGSATKSLIMLAAH